jgi:hypothetical protein
MEDPRAHADERSGRNAISAEHIVGDDSARVSSDVNLNIVNNNFILSALPDLQKYKITDTSGNYGYLWTLMIDVSNNNYTNVPNINDPIIVTNNDTLIMDLSGYTYNSVLHILDVSNNNLYFKNYFTNVICQQVYYSPIILTNNKLNQLEYNFNSSDILYANLKNVGTINKNNINGNQIKLNKVDNYKYIIAINSTNKYVYNVINVDLSNNILTIDDNILPEKYNIYGLFLRRQKGLQ